MIKEKNNKDLLHKRIFANYKSGNSVDRATWKSGREIWDDGQAFTVSDVETWFSHHKVTRDDDNVSLEKECLAIRTDITP